MLEYAKSQFLHLHRFKNGSTPRFAASGFDPEKHAGNCLDMHASIASESS